MPRGTRALHEFTKHEERGDFFVATIPEKDTILVNCWCDRWPVEVSHYDFRELGLTYSCGAPECVSPRGLREVAAEREGLPHRKGNVRIYKKPQEIITKFDIAMRRDAVESLYRQGLSPTAIAARLGERRHTIGNDLTWLQTKGRLARRRQTEERSSA